jgi:hypothetical protein
LEAAGHHTLLHHRSATAGRIVECGLELFRAFGLHADVVQARSMVAQKLTIDILPMDRCDQLELHVTEVAQRDTRNEVGGRTAIGASIRSEVHIGYPHPLPDT